jgi:hypothetical protein
MKAFYVHKFVSPADNEYDDPDGFPVTCCKENNENPDTPIQLDKNQMLIQVLACMVEGNLCLMHPKQFPFVPCNDVCGRVVNANQSPHFSKGDIVVADNGMA